MLASKKERISISLYKLDKYNEKDEENLVYLFVFYSFEECKMNEDNVNILRPQLFNLFPIVNYVWIDTTRHSCMFSLGYIFSLSALLGLVAGTSVQTV